MRFIILLLIIFLTSSTLARADSLEQRIDADPNCLAGLKAVDKINADEKANKGSVGDVIDMANRGLRTIGKCKDADGVTYTRGMLTSCQRIRGE